MNALIERADDLHPYFQPIVRAAIERCYSRGLYVFIMQGRRRRAYQACLYARGRVAAGAPLTVRDLTVTTELRFGKVTARCGDQSYVVPASEWHRKVTNVLDSWHIAGFAVDLGFRSGANASDALNLDLEKRRAWGEIERTYAAIAAVWREVVPAIRWGNDWDGDGITVGPDPDERFVDMPHFEWHPGKTLEQVARGEVPPFPRQCPECDNFPAVFVERQVVVGDRGWKKTVCKDCGDRGPTIDVKCVGLK